MAEIVRTQGDQYKVALLHTQGAVKYPGGLSVRPSATPVKIKSGDALVRDTTTNYTVGYVVPAPSTLVPNDVIAIANTDFEGKEEQTTQYGEAYIMGTFKKSHLIGTAAGKMTVSEANAFTNIATNEDTDSLTVFDPFAGYSVNLT